MKSVLMKIGTLRGPREKVPSAQARRSSLLILNHLRAYLGALPFCIFLFRSTSLTFSGLKPHNELESYKRVMEKVRSKRIRFVASVCDGFTHLKYSRMF